MALGATTRRLTKSVLSNGCSRESLWPLWECNVESTTAPLRYVRSRGISAFVAFLRCRTCASCRARPKCPAREFKAAERLALVSMFFAIEGSPPPGGFHCPGAFPDAGARTPTNSGARAGTWPFVSCEGRNVPGACLHNKAGRTAPPHSPVCTRRRRFPPSRAAAVRLHCAVSPNDGSALPRAKQDKSARRRNPSGRKQPEKEGQPRGAPGDFPASADGLARE